MQKIAAIDTGSNALRLVLANLDDAWRVEPADSIRIPIRLGQDVFTDEVLQETTLQQTVEAFIQFRRIADDFGISRMKAVGTSAIREARNRDVLIDRIYNACGIELEVISGEEEARLVHLAVSAALDLEWKRAALVDIGGGSVEVTVAKNGSILSTNSYSLGTVRLLQRLQGEAGARFPYAFVMLLRDHVEAARKRIEHDIGDEKIDICVGTGGNVEEIGKLSQRLFMRANDRSVTVTDLGKLIEYLSRMSIAERIHRLKLRPDRADVILPAAIVLNLVADITGVREILIPSVGLKNGLLLDMAQDMAEQMHLPNREQVWESAVRLGQKYHLDMDHASLVAKLAGRLFDQTEKLHFLGDEERLILEIGALLHDVGHFLNTVDHDRHGYYILKANHILGLSERQQEMVAGLLVFHRKGFPYRDEAASRTLSQKDRLSMSKLCALLRLADALDTSHTQRVTDVTIQQNKSDWRIHLEGHDDLTLEKWSLLKRRALFQDIFGVALEIEE